MGWQDLEKRLKELSKLKTSVGWHETAKYPDGTPVAQAAVVAEYGNSKNGTPPRPILRVAIRAHSKEWRELAAKGFTAVVEGRRTPEQVMMALGEKAAGDSREVISHKSAPSLAESTIKRRTREGYQPDKPLVRTGLMLSTLTSETKK